jgi:hypothetical protein
MSQDIFDRSQERSKVIVNSLIDELQKDDSIGITMDEIHKLPLVNLDLAPQKLVVTLSYNFLTRRNEAGHYPVPKLLDSMGCTNAAVLTVIAPGMLENTLINITSRDFAGESTKPPGLRTRSKTVNINGVPAGNYVLKLSSRVANAYLEPPFGNHLVWDCDSFPSIKIEGDGDLLVNIDYPRILSSNKGRPIQESWMFAVGS